MKSAYCWLKILIPALLAGLPLVATAQAPAAFDSAAAPVQRTASGLRYQVLTLGTGKRPVAGSQVAVRYVGRLPDGKVFDQIRPDQRPFRFHAGRSEVIKGWDELLLLLPAGSRVRAWVPSELAYGSIGQGTLEDAYDFIVPPDTDLEFDLHLVQVR